MEGVIAMVHKCVYPSGAVGAYTSNNVGQTKLLVGVTEPLQLPAITTALWPPLDKWGPFFG